MPQGTSVKGFEVNHQWQRIASGEYQIWAWALVLCVPGEEEKKRVKKERRKTVCSAVLVTGSPGKMSLSDADMFPMSHCQTVFSCLVSTSFVSHNPSQQAGHFISGAWCSQTLNLFLALSTEWLTTLLYLMLLSKPNTAEAEETTCKH